MKSKIVLFSVVAVLALFAVSAVPSAFANGLDDNKVRLDDNKVSFVPDKGRDNNEVYFVPGNSYGQYCENIPVLIRVDAVDLTTGAGMNIYFDPDCVNITDVNFTGTPYNTLAGWTHEGNYVHIGVMGPLGPIEAGTHLIANLTLHCEKETECTSNLAFAETELLDYDGDPLPNVIWRDGTFTCGVPGQDNEVYFVPKDSYGPYCENIPVLIRVDAVDLTTGAGMNIYFDPDCVNITDVNFTGTPYSTLTGWTHEGNYVHIGVMGPLGPIEAGTHLIANLALHCENETECTSNLAFAETELLDYDGDPLPNVIWHDGTFTCVDEPDLNVTEITLNCGYLFANESNEICAKIENIGGGDAGAFNVRFDIDGFSTEVGIAGLAAGANITVCINDTTIRNAGDAVTITVTADCNDEVDESDETNNELILATTVVNNGYKGKRYTGGEDINTWDTFELNGNLIYSPGDSYYLSAFSHPNWTEYNVGWTASDLPIPGTATVTEARLYVPYTWDKSGVMPAYAAMSFNGNPQTLDAHYSDEKGWGTSYPYGMLVYDVTADFDTSGNAATLTNSYPGGDSVSMRGMLLVVVYADDSEPERTILMNEGFDLLYGGAGKCTTPEEATAYAPFGSIDTTEVQQATLITVAPGAGPDEGDLGFNTHMWYDIWNFVGSTEIGIAETDVTSYLQAADNEAYFRSSADYMEASNAFLICECRATGYGGSVYRDGQWFLRTEDSPLAKVYSFWWGWPDDIPVTGDWDGDGEDTIGVYRDGRWYLSNSITNPSIDHEFWWGRSTDIPVTGDWNNDGTDTIGVYRDGRWYLSNSITNPSVDHSFWWGWSTDTPVTGDWDGDGTDTIGVYRDGKWYLSNSITNPSIDHEFWWGWSTDTPVTGDWNNDGTDTIGVYRGGRWLLSNSITVPSVDQAFWWGWPSDTPVTGQWS